MMPVSSGVRVVFVFAGVACSVSVSGQEPSISSGGLEKVVVTAERRAASQQDIPIAISAFDEQKLEALGVIESGDIAAYTPNLRMNKTPVSQNAYGISIRGISSSFPVAISTCRRHRRRW